MADENNFEEVTTTTIIEKNESNTFPKKKSLVQSFYEFTWKTKQIFFVLILIGAMINNYLLLDEKSNQILALQTKVNLLSQNVKDIIDLKEDYQAEIDRNFNDLKTSTDNLFFSFENRLIDKNLEIEESISGLETRLKLADIRIDKAFDDIENQQGISNFKLQEIIFNTDEKLNRVEERLENVEKPITELETLLEEEFNDSVSSASSEFFQNVKEEQWIAKNKIDQFFESFPQTLKNKIEELDGYIKRGKNDYRETKKQLITFIDNELEKNIQGTVSKFKQIYRAELETLKNRLLIAEVSSLENIDEELFKHHRVNQLSEKLNNGGLLKTADEALTWVPFVGDVYDIGRSFVYDPRFEWEYKKMINTITNNIKEDVKSSVEVLPYHSSYEGIASLCRENFDKKYALKAYFRGTNG